MGWNKEEIWKVPIIWSDLLKLDSSVIVYEEIVGESDRKKLLKVLVEKQEDYNINTTDKLDLVLFEDAVNHILRVSRVLRQPRGNIMLIGVGGSGK